MAQEATEPFHSPLDTKSRDRSLKKGRTLALHSNPEQLPSRSVDGACHTLGPKPEPSLCFQTAGPAALSHTPSTLGPLEPQRRTVPALFKETLPIPLATNLQIRRMLQDPRGHPNSVGCPGHTGVI